MNSIKPLLAALSLLFHPSPNNMILTQHYGDLVTHSIPLMRDGAVFTPGTDWNLIFTAKRRSSDPDASAIIQKTTGIGLTVTGSTAAIEIVPQDTDALILSVLVWDIQAQDRDGAIATVAEGRLNLTRDVTRATTVSIPIHTTTPPVLLGPPGKSAYQLAVDGGYTGTQQQWLASLGGAPAPTILDNILFTPINSTPASLVISGTLDPDAASACSYLNHVNGFPSWGNGIDSSPQTAIVQNDGQGNWWINAAYADYQYSAYCPSTAASPVGLTGWIIVKGTGQPTIAAMDDAIAGIPGSPGNTLIVGESDIYMCVRQTPVKWVMISTDYSLIP